MPDFAQELHALWKIAPVKGMIRTVLRRAIFLRS
jgi:hypothetical protein